MWRGIDNIYIVLIEISNLQKVLTFKSFFTVKSTFTLPSYTGISVLGRA